MTFKKVDSIPVEVREGIFLGSIGAVCNQQILEELDIRDVLTLGNERVFGLTPSNARGRHLKVCLDDASSSSLVDVLPECLGFIEESVRAGQNVLIHCFQGKSRSVSVMAAYLIKTEGLTFLEAIDDIRVRRPVACPNIGFALQLNRWATALSAQEK